MTKPKYLHVLPAQPDLRAKVVRFVPQDARGPHGKAVEIDETCRVLGWGVTDDGGIVPLLANRRVSEAAASGDAVILIFDGWNSRGGDCFVDGDGNPCDVNRAIERVVEHATGRPVIRDANGQLFMADEGKAA